MRTETGVKQRAWQSVCVGIGLVLALPALAKEPKVELTVYNTNLGFVRERRDLLLPKGIGEVKFTDVASGIDATSVHFKSLTDPSVTVVEQNYEYDLVNADKLLRKYIDQQISVLTKDKGDLYEGALLSFDHSQLLLKTRQGLAMVNRQNIQDIRFKSLPEGLITRPTLVWTVDGKQGGKQRCEIAYLTSGINWRCDYTVVVNAKDTQFKDFAGWVTINNHSGATYKEARLKLIAGDVHRVQPPQYLWGRRKQEEVELYDKAKGGGFVEKPFFEYHLYTLSRLVTVKDNQIKQEELLNRHDIPITKLYEYDGARHPKVAVKLEFTNDKASHLGMPLPKGRVRVYKEDPATKSLEFVGEDNLDHTPKDEKRKLTLGNAFDLVGERKQTNTKRIGNRLRRDTWELTLKNRKDQDAVTIHVIEHFYGEWELLRESHDSKKEDAFTAKWAIPVKAGEEVILTYTVEYRW